MELENVVNLAMNSGMSILITCYFLYRDWKYQAQLVELLGNVSNTLGRLSEVVEVLRGYHLNDQ